MQTNWINFAIDILYIEEKEERLVWNRSSFVLGDAVYIVWEENYAWVMIALPPAFTMASFAC